MTSALGGREVFSGVQGLLGVHSLQTVLFVALRLRKHSAKPDPAKEMETWPVCGAGMGRGTAADTLPFGPQPQPQAYVCGDDPATASTGSAHAGTDAGSEEGATRRASKQVGAGRHTYTST